MFKDYEKQKESCLTAIRSNLHREAVVNSKSVENMSKIVKDRYFGVEVDIYAIGENAILGNRRQKSIR